LGTFNSENFWKNSNSCVLPSYSDPQSDMIITAMDELQFVFCNRQDDLLITRYPMNVTHKNYLLELGFTFKNNEFSVIDEKSEKDTITEQSLCQLILQKTKNKYLNKLIHDITDFSPFSILPDTHDLCINYQINNIIPSVDVVKKVNSKIFSHMLSKELFINTKGEVVNSADELGYVGRRFLKDTDFIIKDEFGVSGKGNILVKTEKILESIVRYISKQEKKGKETIFLLEPVLNSQSDFSCQFDINPKGELQLMSIQKMQNNGFAFSGIQTAEEDFFRIIDKKEYLKQVELIAKKLYKEGYFGPVCLDSMLLQDGSVVPIIEINARKSMGLINHFLDQFLFQFSQSGSVIFFSLILKKTIKFEELIDKMNKKNILFQKNKHAGIIPLSANTLYINQKSTSEQGQVQPFKGRFYVSVVDKDGEDRERIVNTMKMIFNEFDINVVN
jgi:hypothetical protein